MDTADAAASAIESLFATKFFDETNELWSGIELMNCIAVSEDDLRVSHAKQLMQWRVEHLSYKDEESQAAPINF